MGSAPSHDEGATPAPPSAAKWVQGVPKKNSTASASARTTMLVPKSGSRKTKKAGTTT